MVTEKTSTDYAQKLSITRGILYCLSVAAATALVSLGSAMLIIWRYCPEGGEPAIAILAFWFLAQPVQLLLSLLSFYIYRDEYRFLEKPVSKAVAFVGNVVGILALISLGGLLWFY